jgi:hypothetical protein
MVMAMVQVIIWVLNTITTMPMGEEKMPMEEEDM